MKMIGLKIGVLNQGLFKKQLFKKSFVLLDPT
jgi:hypothetical protein